MVHFRVYGWGCAMAYYKVRIEVWCDWNPAESDLDDITQAMGVGEAICTMREVIAVAIARKILKTKKPWASSEDQRAMRTRVRGRSRYANFFLVLAAGWALRPDHSTVIAMHKRKSHPDRGFLLAFSSKRYCFTVRGSVSLKLSMDSAGRTISFSPV